MRNAPAEAGALTEEKSGTTDTGLSTPRRPHDQALLDQLDAARKRLDAFCDLADHALTLRRLMLVMRTDFDLARLIDLDLLGDDVAALHRGTEQHKRGRP
jgi:hypothetical protein